jgi:hypothetical protein
MPVNTSKRLAGGAATTPELPAVEEVPATKRAQGRKGNPIDKTPIYAALAARSKKDITENYPDTMLDKPEDAANHPVPVTDTTVADAAAVAAAAAAAAAAPGPVIVPGPPLPGAETVAASGEPAPAGIEFPIANELEEAIGATDGALAKSKAPRAIKNGAHKDKEDQVEHESLPAVRTGEEIKVLPIPPFDILQGSDLGSGTKRKRYPADYKLDVVRWAESKVAGGLGPGGVVGYAYAARTIGVSEKMIRVWKKNKHVLAEHIEEKSDETGGDPAGKPKRHFSVRKKGRDEKKDKEVPQKEAFKAEKAPAVFKICQGCFSMCPGNYTFCGQCGTEIAEQLHDNPVKLCFDSACHAELKGVVTKYCGKCGKEQPVPSQV